MAKEKNTYIKSPMNYTGGKHKLLPQIMPLFPKEINTFVDLFCGGCDVTINAEAKKVVANDLDGNVIGIYKAMKEKSLEEIVEHINSRISEFGLSIDNQEGYNTFRDFYNNAEERNPLDLFTLICYSFNHQIRFNSKGQYNMPFGKNRSQFNDNILKNLTNFHKAITEKEVAFANKSFIDLKVSKLKKGDFVYCDPPYLITCASYNENDGWNEKLEQSLYTLLDTLNEIGVKFAMSNVMMNKGKVNTMLKEWAEKNGYVVNHLDHTYSNCSYHALDRDKNGTDEVLITNYNID